ncbi:MAG: hypothetical protein QOG33_2304 [Gaiellales bacterium]|nr:hypothetical protein [Gaiellales bacterium]
MPEWKYVAGAPATPGVMEVRGAPSSAGPLRTNTNSSCDSIVSFAATSQPLVTIKDTGQRRLDSRADAPARQRVEIVAGGRIVYHRVLDFVGADRATNKVWCPAAIYVNHTSFLKH